MSIQLNPLSQVLKNKELPLATLTESYERQLGEEGLAKAEEILRLTQESREFTFDGYSHLVRVAIYLLFTPKTFERFCSLSSKSRAHILENGHVYFASTRSIELYVATLYSTKLENEIVFKEDFSNLRQLTRSRKGFKKFLSNLKLDKKFFLYVNNLDIYSIVYTIEKAPAFISLFLLREKYGESVVIELISRYEIEKRDIKLIEIVEILEYWDEYKDLSLEWIHEMIQVKL
jgi:hypothetical protein